MKPIEFEEQNFVFAKDQPQYQPLPVHVDRTKAECPVTSCWELSDDEKAEIIRTGKIYLNMWTFGNPLTPVMLSVNKSDFLP